MRFVTPVCLSLNYSLSKIVKRVLTKRYLSMFICLSLNLAVACKFDFNAVVNMWYWWHWVVRKKWKIGSANLTVKMIPENYLQDKQFHEKSIFFFKLFTAGESFHQRVDSISHTCIYLHRDLCSIRLHSLCVSSIQNSRTKSISSDWKLSCRERKRP